jgi:hypothetical protein
VRLTAGVTQLDNVKVADLVVDEHLDSLQAIGLLNTLGF